MKFLTEEELKKAKASEVAKGDNVVLDNGDTGEIVAIEKSSIHVPARKVTTIVATVRMNSGAYAGKAVDIHLEGSDKISRKTKVPKGRVAWTHVKRLFNKA